ncbi:MAG TPA: transporter [Flavitalea sp.]|nr:transporter [Flavitalea sp.]
MKKLQLLIVFGMLCIFGSLDASAQSLSKKFSFGIGLEGGLPTGDAKDAYNLAGGLTLRLAYQLGDGFATLTSGGIAFIPENLDGGDDMKVGLLIPVRAGYKYIIKDRFFVMGELGYGSFRQYYADENDELASVSDGGFLFAPSAGVQFNVLEIGLRYESVSLPGGSLSSVGLRLGFNF